MAITPVGGMVYANQGMQAPATQQAEFQQRLDAQNSAAMVATNEEQKEIEEVRPTEESYEVDPEKEHEQQKHDEEAGAEEEQILSKKNENDDEVISLESDEHLLDIKI